MLYLVIILYALFGFTFTLGKIILNYAPPFFAVGSRMLIAGVGLTLYAWYAHRVHCKSIRKDILLYVQYIFFGIVFFYCSRAWALQRLSTTKSALLFTLLPFFTALFSYIKYKEKLTYQKVVGLAIGFLGMIPILLTHAPSEDSVFSLSFFSFPELLTIASVASLSYGLLIMRELIRHRNCPPAIANGVSMLIAGIITVTGSYCTEPRWLIGPWQWFLPILALQVTLSNVICANLQARLLKHYSATFLAFASFISPLCAAGYGCLLLRETD